MSHFPRKWTGLAVLIAALAPLSAAAQTLEYGDAGATGETASDGRSSSQAHSKRHRGGRNGSYVAPYIEAQQVVSAELSPGNDVVTYSTIAAGVDANVAGRNNAASVSLRYERRIGWGNERSGDTISGLARAYTSVVPQVLRIDAGVLAARTRVENGGAAVLAPLGDSDSVTQIYSAYAGPTLTTEAGDAKIDAPLPDWLHQGRKPRFTGNHSWSTANRHFRQERRP